MDRNKQTITLKAIDKRVALRKESVDRNAHRGLRLAYRRPSLSARRAWIEIKSGLHPLMASLVALRKESVDRNLCSIGKYGSQAGVALRKESVDRNSSSYSTSLMPLESLSARRAWIEIAQGWRV